MDHNDGVTTSHYEALGVPPSASFEVVRRAYRARMRALHPDSAGGQDVDTHVLAALSTAWRVLSDPDRRADYDMGIAGPSPVPGPQTVVDPPPPPQSARSRREAWVFGVRAQILHLSSRAGKSATQTLLLKGSRASRAEYDELVEGLVAQIASDTEARVRAARAAGAAPLDLGVGATLLGIRAAADQLRRATTHHRNDIDLMEAELLDRMWDVLAHELPVALATALGGNPGVGRHLRRAS